MFWAEALTRVLLWEYGGKVQASSNLTYALFDLVRGMTDTLMLGSKVPALIPLLQLASQDKKFTSVPESRNR